MSSLTALRFLAAAALAAVLAAAQAPPAKAPAPPPAQASMEPEYATSREFKSRLFTVQHCSPYQLERILKPLTSGFRGTLIVPTERDGLMTLSVRDFPENLAAIEEALKRVDVAAPPRAEVELHIHVLFASRQEGPSEGFPEELKDVVATLKSTLNYRSYTHATSFVQLAVDGSESLRGKGEVEMVIKSPKGERTATPVGFDWGIRLLKVESPQGGPMILDLKGFELSGWERLGPNSKVDLAVFRTDLDLKDGEKVVVGTSSIKDKGLIVVVTAKVLK